MKKSLVKYLCMTLGHRHRIVIGGVTALSIAAVGTLILTNGRAITPAASSEAESGSVTAPATKIADPGASAGMAIKFGTGNSDTSPLFTFASIPDTQQDMYNTTNINNNFNGRLNYLVQNKTALNLKYVWQVGDLQDTDNLVFSSNLAVNPRYINSTTFNVDHFQYEKASAGLKILENASVPYALTVGNHDTGAVCGGPACPVVAGQTQTTPIEVRNTSVWNKYYPPSRYPGLVIYEAGKTDNAYRLFQAGGLSWLVLNLELWPRTGVVDWAKTVVAAHPHENVIITTHSYLVGGGTIDQSNGGYGANTMQYVYNNLVSKYANVRFVFSGHVGASNYRLDTGVNGNKIYSFADCYHDSTNNWIRLLSFNTSANTVSTKVYSPLTHATRTEADANVNLTGISWVH